MQEKNVIEKFPNFNSLRKSSQMMEIKKIDDQHANHKCECKMTTLNFCFLSDSILGVHTLNSAYCIYRRIAVYL